MPWARSNHGYDPRTYEDLDGAVIKDGVVVALPYCPSGKCWMTHKGGRRERVRMKRQKLQGGRQFRLVCHRCKQAWRYWA